MTKVHITLLAGLQTRPDTASHCYPARVGADTPIGTFPLTRRYTAAKGYGGDGMQFATTATDLFAVHRVWLGNPHEHRVERLAGSDPTVCRTITYGCVNVMPDVYDAIVGADTLEIRG